MTNPYSITTKVVMSFIFTKQIYSIQFNKFYTIPKFLVNFLNVKTVLFFLRLKYISQIICCDVI